MLEHIDHLLRMVGRESNFGYAAHSISKLKEPLSNIELSGIKGVNGEVRKIIDQILETGTSSYLERILFT
jgi:DNA polymerase/3'-5' exonuclease PolX